MAEESVIIRVGIDAESVAAKLKDISTQMVDVKNKQADLNTQFKEGKITAAEHSQQTAKLKDNLAWLQKEQKGLTATMKIATATNDTYSDSLNGQRQKLADMQKAYAELSKEQRDSKAGKEFAKNIKEQSDSVKEMEKSIGDTSRNVGNYEEALKSAGVGIDGFKAKMKAMLANPWALLIAAIVTAVKKLVDAFKSSEDRMNELKTAFAPLQGAVDLIKQGFDALAKVVSKGVVFALEKAVDGVGWVARALDKLGAKFGKNFGLEDAFNAAAKNSEQATEAEQRYIKHRREFVETEAKLNNDIAKLRDKATQKDKYSAEERVKFLELAISKEKQISDEKVQLAKENLKALEAEAARSENDAEMNDKLAEARAAVVIAETEYFNNTRRLQSQLQTFRAEVLAVTAATIAEEDATEKTTQADKDAEKAKADRAKKYDDLVAKIKQWTQTELEALEEQYQQDISFAELTEEQRLAIERHYQEERDRINKEHSDKEVADYQNSLDAKAAAVQDWAGKATELYTAISSALKATEDAELANYKKSNEEKKNALNDRLNKGLISQEQYNAQTAQLDAELDKKTAEIQDKQAKREKALGIFQAGINTAVAIISAMKEAFPLNIILSALAATTGAAQIAAIAATPLPSASFADGGIVPGNSYTGDKLTVRANSGEMYLNRAEQKSLFDGIKSGNFGGGVDYELLGATMAQAVAAQPAPVMDYTEFKQFGQKVSTYQEIASV